MCEENREILFKYPVVVRCQKYFLFIQTSYCILFNILEILVYPGTAYRKALLNLIVIKESPEIKKQI